MAGSSKGLAFILGAEGVKEQNQKERDAICMSLDGLRKAARLSCALGTGGSNVPGPVAGGVSLRSAVGVALVENKSVRRASW